MYAKVKISGNLEVKTGMHIGGSSAFSAIGAVDSPVIRDVLSNLPMIPGTSLKGKMRTLLAKSYNRDMKVSPDDDDPRLTRLFGSAKKGSVHSARLIVGDMFMSNEAELRSMGLQTMTEVKFENTINRATAVSNPRQIERAIRGSRFELNMIYDITSDKQSAEDILAEAAEDMKTLADGMHMLQLDYLGGHGTRGYGKVQFDGIHLECVFGEIPENVLQEWEQVLTGAIAAS